MSGFKLGRKADEAGYRLVSFDTVGSTNTEALEAARAGDAGRIWFAALQQTAGRGRRGRPWISSYGNLAASLLIVPDADPSVLATLGFVAGVALNKAMNTVLPGSYVRIGIDGADGHTGQGSARIALKWPNDVLADGAKLAGIMLEAVPREKGSPAIVVGIGVNIVAAPEGLPYPATSTSDLGSAVSAADVFAALSDTWVEIYDLWQQGNGLPAVLNAWRQVAAGIGAEVAVSVDGDVVRGVFETVDESGRLIMRTSENKRISVTAGDVHFGATATFRGSEPDPKV